MNEERKDKKTLGTISDELRKKDPGGITFAEQAKLNMTNYEENIQLCIDRALKEHPGDFYIVVMNKIEPILKNVARNYFAHLSACPTPNYDQTVMKYHRAEGKLEDIWTIPARPVCFYLLNSALELDGPLEKLLLKYVMDFNDGTLFKLCKHLNGERKDSNLKEKV